MKVCPKCGKTSDSKFCPECGYSLADITDETTKVIEEQAVEVVDKVETTENIGSSIEEEVASVENTSEQPATPVQEPLNIKKEKFYQKTWFVILMLLAFAPAGIFLMWKYKKFKKPVKIALSVILGLNFLFWAFLIFVLLLPCDHEWAGATCDSPKTCTICGDTEGEALGHEEGDWVLTEEATLVDVGVEELLCARCEESLDSRGTECKDAKVDGNVFNFTDEELIDWINDISTAEVEYEDLELFDSDSPNTSYRVLMNDGEDKGALILNHSSGKDEINAIMIYFEEYESAAALAIYIGEKIDSDFDSDDAFIEIVNDDSYTKAGMTVTRINLDTDFEVTVLAPNEFFEEILD